MTRQTDLNVLFQQAIALHQSGNIVKAIRIYRQLKTMFPKHPRLLFLLGTAELHSGNLQEAIALLETSIKIAPNNAEAYNNRGNALRDLKRLDEALVSYERAIQLESDYADAYNNRGNALRDLKRLDEALVSYERAIQLEPDHAAAYFNRGNALSDLERLDEALVSYERAIQLEPDYAAAYYNRGNTLYDLKRLDEALVSYEHAIQLAPSNADAYYIRGKALYDLKRLDEALVSYERAIVLKPDYADAYNSRGNALRDLKRLDEALISFERAIQLGPGNADAYYNRGNALSDLKRLDEALVSYERAIQLKPDYADAYNNRGNALYDLKRLDEALVSYERAIQLKPGNADAYNNRGQALRKAKNYAEAIKSFEALVRINPEYPFGAGNLLHAKMLCCDWRDFDELSLLIRTALSAGKKCAEPFGYQAVSESEEDLLKCAEVFAASEYPPPAALPAREAADHADRITIGYLCGEFRQQATTILLCGVFEAHDRERFRLIAFDNGWDDGSEYRKRVSQSFDEIVDITRAGDLEVARLIRERNVDILVNLNGYFGEARLGVFALKPSPIQVNYLGFPGTIGVSYIDYLIADRVVIAEASRRHYAEKIVYLPNSYQANDSKRRISDRPMDRAEFDLPAEAFVFCCFNNNYKITPSTFEAWVRILERVPGSVLWVLEDNPQASANLIKEAEQRGVSERRLIFAGRMPLSEHLARHRLADLFLDTLPYNAHTTASDALWAGLPVLTQAGTTFPGRVAASLLRAIDLPELVTTTAQEYEDLAVELAVKPEKLRAIREKLARNRLTQPLFDTRLFARHLESAYAMMFDRYRGRLAPEHLSVGS